MAIKREWLVGIRSKLNLSQREAASRCGISYQMFAAIESGTRRPSVDVAQTIADKLFFTDDGKSWTFFFEK